MTLPATTAPAYFDQTDMIAFIGEANMLAVCDDGNSGSIDPVKFNKMGKIACGKVDSVIALNYPGPFPITQVPVPALVVELAMTWMKALLYESDDIYVRQYGSGPREEALALSSQLTEAKSLLTDWLVSPKPGNVGGNTYNRGARMTIDNVDGSSNEGW